MYNLFFNTKIGILEIICNKDYLLEIKIVDKKDKEESNQLCLKVKKQLEEYFNQKRTIFDIPIKLTGTKFQNEVWNSIMKIPFGQTITYLELAKDINNPKGVRAVANAVGSNKILIIIPCHRIVGTDKTLTGFSGGLENKIKLLKLENNKILIKQNLKKSLIIK